MSPVELVATSDLGNQFSSFGHLKDRRSTIILISYMAFMMQIFNRPSPEIRRPNLITIQEDLN